MLEDLFPKIEESRAKLRKRGYALAAEHYPPAGQAAQWYADVIQCVPRSGQLVAKQLARLCGQDSLVTVPWRSLADAVGVRDSAGRERAYTERGVQVLIEAGWLTVETIGLKRGAKTTFSLEPGERATEWLGWIDADDWLDEAA
ncbi:hypothetical protein [Streptomyces sp. B1I3]|uniref:hypothetical protein n=1 Tax=Streptomyces sp. B1I3 TaxID=3042264 RepID=UPI0027813FC2|nr:hypothetical protein [Streptomyces sp. B1I3]MDQ0793730.1 hypothetical protein [Streptomyces sp. B1I3]